MAIILQNTQIFVHYLSTLQCDNLDFTSCRNATNSTKGRISKRSIECVFDGIILLSDDVYHMVTYVYRIQ